MSVKLQNFETRDRQIEAINADADDFLTELALQAGFQ
jgi:hypothetical protein